MEDFISGEELNVLRNEDLMPRLNLLHQIYSGDTEVSSTDITIKAALTIFKNSVTIPYNNENENHRNALITLRDTLLADY
jgi:hypothetical protein